MRRIEAKIWLILTYPSVLSSSDLSSVVSVWLSDESVLLSLSVPFESVPLLSSSFSGGNSPFLIQVPSLC